MSELLLLDNPLQNYKLYYDRLKKYRKFSFKKPRGKKNFNSQQKSAIYRAWQRIGDMVTRVEKGEYSFLPFRSTTQGKLMKARFKNLLDACDTGYFVRRPNAKLTYNKKLKEFNIESDFLGRSDLFIPLPKKLYNHPELIPDWLSQTFEKSKQAKLKTYMSVSIKGSRATGTFDNQMFSHYFMEAFNALGGAKGQLNAINGVYLTYLKGGKLHGRKSITNAIAKRKPRPKPKSRPKPKRVQKNKLRSKRVR